MLVSELMSVQVISLRTDESVSLAARLLSRNNIGALPVCDGAGYVRGIVTDRDLVTRCMAQGRNPETTSVAEIMSRRIATIEPGETVETALRLMGKEQVRRVPVTEKGRLSGMVSLSDLSHLKGAETVLEKISAGVSRR